VTLIRVENVILCIVARLKSIQLRFVVYNLAGIAFVLGLLTRPVFSGKETLREQLMKSNESGGGREYCRVTYSFVLRSFPSTVKIQYRE